MKYSFRLGEIKILVNSEEELKFSDGLEIFEEYVEEKEADVIYSVSYKNEENFVQGQLVKTGLGYEIYKNGNNWIYQYNVGNHINAYKALLYCENVNTYHLYLPLRHKKLLEKGFNLSNMMGLEWVFSHYGHIIMHASIVGYRDEAILFTGASGVGKSTQAQLWRLYKNADILNGDKTLIRVEDRITAYGSPFAGSSGIICNKKLPVKAIILLEHAPYNQITKLEGVELFKRLYPRFWVQEWEESLCVRELDLIEKILKNIPVYLLKCRPEKGAVELVEHTIFV